MPTYEIDGPDGKTYEIEGPPGATREQIVERVKASMGQQTAPQPQPEKPSALVDSVRSVPGGLAKGVAAVVGLPGDLSALGDAGLAKLASMAGASPEFIEKMRAGVQQKVSNGPTSAAINNSISKPFGGYYKPKTTAGEYTETIASFAPSALSPGSVPARLARVVIPGAMSETGGQLTKGTKLEPYMRAGGAILGGGLVGAGEGLLASRKAPPIPTNADLRTQANKIYANAKSAGVTINPSSYDNLVSDIQTAVKDAGTHPKLHPKVSGVLDSLDEAKGGVLELGDLERLRRIAKGAASSIEPDERRVAGVILDKIDDFTENLGPADVLSGNAQVAGTLSEARGLWSKMRKSELIDEAVSDAKTRATAANGNYAAALRGEFQKLVRNDKLMRGFSAAEKAAIKKVATVGPTSGALAMLGALRPRGLVAIGELGAGAMHPEAAMPMLATAAAGQGAQWASNALTARNARLASELARSGTQAPAAMGTNPLILNALLSRAAHP